MAIIRDALSNPTTLVKYDDLPGPLLIRGPLRDELILPHGTDNPADLPDEDISFCDVRQRDCQRLVQALVRTLAHPAALVHEV